MSSNCSGAVRGAAISRDRRSHARLWLDASCAKRRSEDEGAVAVVLSVLSTPPRILPDITAVVFGISLPKV